jgi:hypothetical protein
MARALTTKAIAEYVGRTFKQGGEVRRAEEQLKIHVLDLPTRLSTNLTNDEKMLQSRQYDMSRCPKTTSRLYT